MKHVRITQISRFWLYRFVSCMLVTTLLCTYLLGYTIPVQAITPPVFLQVDVTLDSNDVAYQACTSSPGDCSLRGAISKANSDNANVYQINLPAGIYTLSISGRLEDANAQGDLDIITGTLSIVGADSATTIIDANSLDRVLHVHSGAYLGLNRVTITGGNPYYISATPGTDGADGGGIYNAGTLNVQNSLIIDNSAGNGSPSTFATDGGDGGGIYNESTLFIYNSVLEANSSGLGSTPSMSSVPGGDGGHGGGLYTSGTAEFTIVSFISNITGHGGSGYPGGNGGHGGAIVNSGIITITTGTFQNNITGWGAEGMGTFGGSGGDGGAIYNTGQLSMSGSQLTLNVTGRANAPGFASSPDSHGGHGGGLYTSGTATISGTSFTDNTTGDGPDFGSYVGSDGGNGGYGGGIYASGVITLNHSTLSGNMTGIGGQGSSRTSSRGGDGGYGGGLYNVGICSSTDITITNNTTGNGGSGLGSSVYPDSVGTGGDGGHGAGIYSAGTMTLTHSIVTDNTTGNGALGASNSLSDGAAYGGNGGMGGGIYNDQVMTITHTAINGNLTGNGNAATCNTTGMGCDAYGGYGGNGGGLAQQTGATLWLADSDLENNSTGSGGDATGDTITDGDGGNGGAIANTESTVDAIYISFMGNYTRDSSNGGAVYDDMGTFSITNATFTRNSTYGGGEGGAFFTVSDTPHIVNALFVANWADSYGGAISALNSSPIITNCTFVENTAHWDQGAVLYSIGSGVPEIYNSILWANTGGNPIQSDVNVPYVQDSIIEGGFSAGTNITAADPAFVRNPDPGDDNWLTPGDNDYGDLHLLSSSPAIDAGNNSSLPVDALDLDNDSDFAETLPDDLDGNPRQIDVSWVADTGSGSAPVVDMGAYEYIAPHFVYLSIVSRD